MTVTAPGPAWPAAPPDHLIDLAEWDALPEDNSARFELVEGVMVVSPRAVPRHQDLMLRIAMQLRAALPGLVILTEVELVIDGHRGGPATVRVPDVVVATQALMDGRPRAWGDEVVAVVEVLSPGSRRTDRVAKLAEYAEIGVAHYLIVEPGDPVRVTELRLDAADYALVAVHEAVAPLAIGVTLSL